MRTKFEELIRLIDHFCKVQSTRQGKSKQIRALMQMHQMNPNWSLPSLIDQDPMAWMISVNGFIIDIRHTPRAIQEEAFQEGFYSVFARRDAGRSGIEHK